MRLITGCLATILATLALAGPTVGAVNTNTLTGTVGPGFTPTHTTAVPSRRVVGF